MARLVAAGLPHHITQCGKRRQQTFFHDEDYAAYIQLMAEWCGQRGVYVWAYCLMPNHVHLIAVPQSEDRLRRAIGEAHRRYTRRINLPEKWRGFLDSAIREQETQALRDHCRTGHPLGSATFVERLEQAAGGLLRPRKPGRPAKFAKQPN